MRNARGLLGRSSLPAGQGMLISDPLGMIHTWFMRFPIDVVFLDRGGQVVRVAEAVAPWRLVRASGARRMLELGAGEAARLGIGVGARLAVEA